MSGSDLPFGRDLGYYQNKCRELERRINQMQGDGYMTAAEALADWWSMANVQGVATMTGDEMMDITAEWQAYEREQPPVSDELQALREYRQVMVRDSAASDRYALQGMSKKGRAALQEGGE